MDKYSVVVCFFLFLLNFYSQLNFIPKHWFNYSLHVYICCCCFKYNYLCDKKKIKFRFLLNSFCSVKFWIIPLVYECECVCLCFMCLQRICELNLYRNMRDILLTFYGKKFSNNFFFLFLLLLPSDKQNYVQN